MMILYDSIIKRIRKNKKWWEIHCDSSSIWFYQRMQVGSR